MKIYKLKNGTCEKYHFYTIYFLVLSLIRCSSTYRVVSIGPQRCCWGYRTIYPLTYGVWGVY